MSERPFQCSKCGNWKTPLPLDADDECPEDASNSCIITSNSSQLENNIHLFTNPANKFINISENSTWEIIDIYGTVLTQGQGNKIDLTSLPSGIYTIKTDSTSHKVIKK